ncbi:hypothetical protein K502DRAFT_324183 [Neoconidiobolus thromboides FSU 785]|nr:hypothetical protein K502DRAFT_324183 [Neoconidiobolus thromboides FSU 785]
MTLGLKNLFGSNQNQTDNNLNNDYFNYSAAVVQTKWIEDNHVYYLKVALPGLTEKEINVKVDDATGDPSNPLITIEAGVEYNSNQFNNQQQQGQQQGHGLGSLFSNNNNNQYQQAGSNSFYSAQTYSQYQDLNTPYPLTNYSQYNSFANRFYLSFPVPTSRVKVDDIQANTDNGVLTVKFPKQPNAQTQGARPISLGKSRL